MAEKLSDIILLSDIDGTLMNAPAPIPPRNIEALNRFTKEGGRFGLATGRSVESARRFQKQLPVTAPCIIFNGGAAYDYQQEKLLFMRQLPKTYQEYINIVVERFPTIGVSLFTSIPNPISVARFEYSKEYLGLEMIDFIEKKLEQITEPVAKCIFVAPEDWLPDIMSFIDSQQWPDVSFVRSSENFYEMLPKDVTKGSGLLQLSDAMNKPLEDFVVIGDYYNDEMMLRTASYAATVANAPDDIKALCDVVVCDCMQGALAELVEHLEQKYHKA